MPTPSAAQGAPSWSSPSGGGATSSASASSPSYSSDPSSSSSPPAALDPTTTSSSPASSSPQADPSSSTPPPPSCAACRHQRRRCEPDCLLKPYFITDDPDKFQNALRMFGVRNLQRMLRAVPPPRRDVCVQTVVYESNLRAADPVRGCCGVIQDLENQLLDTAVELEVLRRRLQSYRQMTRGSAESQPPNPLQIQQQLTRTSETDDMRTQGPYGVPPAANELTATQTQLHGVPPAANELTATQPQLHGVTPAANEIAATEPQLSATEMEPQLSQVQPQLSTMPP